MNNLKAPDPLKMDGNMSENYRRWVQRLELYLTATGISAKDESIQIATFLHVIGPEALEVYNTFKFDRPEDAQKLDNVKAKFKAYCNPRKNITHERHCFFIRTQNETETIDQYVTELRTKASTCEFGDLCDSLIRDRLVCGVRNKTVKDRLLRDADLSLQKAIDICRASEVSQIHLKTLNDENPQVHVVKQRKPAQHGTKQKTQDTQQKLSCQKCGYKHPPNKCPAEGETCNKCFKLNHFAKMCRTPKVDRGHSANQNTGHKKRKPHGRGRGRVQVVQLEDDSEEEYPLFVGEISDVKSNETDWYQEIETENKKTTFKLDTGAQCNVISKTDFDRIGGKIQKGKGKRLVTYTGQKI